MAPGDGAFSVFHQAERGLSEEKAEPNFSIFQSSPTSFLPTSTELAPDGAIHFEGYVFKSPSAFSVYVKRKQVSARKRGGSRAKEMEIAIPPTLAEKGLMASIGGCCERACG